MLEGYLEGLKFELSDSEACSVLLLLLEERGECRECGCIHGRDSSTTVFTGLYGKISKIFKGCSSR